MKTKIIFLFLLFSITHFVWAQKVDVKVFETPGIYFKTPVLLGKVGTHYILKDEPDSAGTPIFIYDSSFQLVTKSYQPASVYAAFNFISHNTIIFSWHKQNIGPNLVSFLQLDETGKKILLKEFYMSSLFAAAGNTPFQLISDRHQQYYLWYALTDNSRAQQTVIRGVIMDTSFNKLKELSYAVDLSKSSQKKTEPIIDGNGNVFLAVYTVPSWFDSNTTGAVNLVTIPFKEDSLMIFSKKFSFGNTKFSDLKLVDHSEKNSIQLNGFYYTGLSSHIKGLTTIQLPLLPSGVSNLQLNVFSGSLRKETRKKVYFSDDKKDILDNLLIKDNLEINGKTFFSVWVMDMPREQFAEYKEKYITNGLYREPVMWGSGFEQRYYPEEVSTHNSFVNRTLDDQQRLNAPVGTPVNIDTKNPGVLTGEIPSPTFSDPVLVRPVVGSPVGSSAMYLNNFSSTGSDAGRQQSVRYAPVSDKTRLVCFTMDANGKVEGYTSVPEFMRNSINEVYSNDVLLFNQPLLVNGKLIYLSEDPAAKRMVDENGNPVLPPSATTIMTSFTNGSADISVQNLKLPYNTTIFKSVSMNNGKFLAPYRDSKNKKSGLVLLQFKSN